MNTNPLDRDAVEQNLLQADTATLLLALVEDTGNEALLEEYRRYISTPFTLTEDFPTEARERIAQLAAEHLIGGGFQEESIAPAPERFRRLSEEAAQRPVAEHELDLFRKEMGLLEDAFVDWAGQRPAQADQYRVIIVGAGLSGIATAIHLKRMGIDFTILDRYDSVGGTWLVNTYPGCAVDILSHYFSYSFRRKNDWSSYYSPQPEVLEYLREVVAEFGLEEHIRFGTTVKSATFDEYTRRWTVLVEDRDGQRTEEAEFFVSAVGALSAPSIPDLPGMDRFQGQIVHSAAWDPAIDVTGKRVALVGNGASANQVGPHIVDRVEHLTVITRSPQWATKAPKYGEQLPAGEIWTLEHIEPYARWFRLRSMLAMNEAMRPNATLDPEYVARGMVNAGNEALKETLTEYMRSELGPRQDLLPHLVPDFPPGMKRMLRDNGWFRMFQRDNVELLPSRAAAMDETGILDDQGNRAEVELVIFATGFKVARMVGSLSIEGTRGSLRDAWGEDDPRAYLGISVPGFPNLFILYGPNTNIGVGGSIFFQAEAQSQHIAQVIRDAIQADVTRVEVREEVYRQYNEDLDAALSTLIWALPTGSTWYRNSKGRVVANMPWTSQHYWDMNRAADLSHYITAPREPAQNQVLSAEKALADA